MVQLLKGFIWFSTFYKTSYKILKKHSKQQIYGITIIFERSR